MRRRKFLQQTGAAAGMVTLLPVKGFASLFAPQVRRVSLPETQQHVRHGEFGPLSAIRVQGVSELTGFRKDVLFQNGFEAGANDLISMRFAWNQQEIGISVLNGTAFITKSGNTESLQLTSGQVRTFTPSNGPQMHLEAFAQEGKRTFSFASKAIVIPIVPPLSVEGKTIADHQAMVIPRGTSFQLRGWKGSSYLILC